MTKALDSRSSENGKEQRSRSFYPDKLSLIDTDPDSLIKYSKRVVNKFVIERLRRFAQINPRQFRKLWLLFQYQDYRVEIDFWSTEYTEDSEPTHLDFVGSIHGRTYKLPKVIWDLLLNKDATDEELIELLIDLPRVEGDGSHLPSVDLGNEISYYANTIINDDDLDNLFALFEG